FQLGRLDLVGHRRRVGGDRRGLHHLGIQVRRASELRDAFGIRRRAGDQCDRVDGHASAEERGESAALRRVPAGYPRRRHGPILQAILDLIRLRSTLLVFLLAAGWAQDWPQWRGPHRDGIGAAIAEPKGWPEQLKRKWQVKVGEGHSSPVVAGGRIYVHARQEDREVVQCLRPESGQVVWQESYAAPYTVNPAATRHGKGVKSTPAVGGNRLYTFGISGILSCFDASTGKLQWRKEFGSPDFGVAMSPVVDRGLLIAHVGTKGKGALTAFDAQTGAEKWSWKGDGPAYASPIVVELGGTRQVVTQS